MGLDMCLKAKTELPYAAAVLMQKSNADRVPGYSQKWMEHDWNRDEENAESRKYIAGLKADSLVELTAEVAYWRKANAIHDWFVDNVQGGEDEGQPSRVEVEHLDDLRAKCEEAIQAGGFIEGLMPREDFFGNTDDPQYYLQDCKDTIEQIDKALGEFPPDKWTYEYYASW